MVRLTNYPTHEHHAMPLMKIEQHHDSHAPRLDVLGEMLVEHCASTNTKATVYYNYANREQVIWVGNEKYTHPMYGGPYLSDKEFFKRFDEAVKTMPKYQAALSVSGFTLSYVDNPPEPV